MGSPPPDGSKNVVFKFRSVSSIVIAPANTGNDVNSNTAVTKIDQTRRGALSIEILAWCMFKIVEIKLIAPMIDEIPAMCREKIVKSIAGPL